MTNQTPKPIENEKSRIAPRNAELSVPASVKIVASPGPTHGIHVTENAIPSGRALSISPADGRRSGPRSYSTSTAPARALRARPLFARAPPFSGSSREAISWTNTVQQERHAHEDHERAGDALDEAKTFEQET